MIQRDRFFPLVRASVFNGSMTQKQVDGINAILDEGEKRGTPLPHLAYFLATPMIETGGRFEPMEEDLNYSVSGLLKTFSRSRISKADAERYGRVKGGHPADEQMIGNLIYGGAFGREHLGNTEPGDGFKYRGRGLAQLTGRRNYTRASSLSGVNLVTNPDRAKELRLSVVVMFDAMTNGWFTGKKLSDYLDGPNPDFVNARRTINGLDRAGDIAAHARDFLAALTASSDGRTAPRPAPAPSQPSPSVQRPVEAAGGLPDPEGETKGPDGQGGLAAFFRWLLSLFGGGK